MIHLQSVFCRPVWKLLCPVNSTSCGSQSVNFIRSHAGKWTFMCAVHILQPKNPYHTHTQNENWQHFPVRPPTFRRQQSDKSPNINAHFNMIFLLYECIKGLFLCLNKVHAQSWSLCLICAVEEPVINPVLLAGEEEHAAEDQLWMRNPLDSAGFKLL